VDRDADFLVPGQDMLTQEDESFSHNPPGGVVFRGRIIH